MNQHGLLPLGYAVTHGEAAILETPMLGLISSVQCPGSVIVQLLDAMRAIRAAGVTVIGGFHSPVERECLELLLSGTQPIVLCQARPSSRLSPAVRSALDTGRLAIVSPTEVTASRVTRSLAAARNDVVVQLAAALFVPYATPGGATETLAQKKIGEGQSVLTFAAPSNTGLVALGAIPRSPRAVASAFAEVRCDE